MPIERNNFTQIPNMIDELGLTPLAIALYLHYARWSGSRRRMPGVRSLMSRFGVSHSAIEKAKRDLESHRLIVIERRADKGLPDYVHVPEIWERNSKHFEKLKPPPVTNESQGKAPVIDESQVTPEPVIDESRHLRSISHSLKDLGLNTENGKISNTNNNEIEEENRLDQMKAAALESIGRFVKKL